MHVCLGTQTNKALLFMNILHCWSKLPFNFLKLSPSFLTGIEKDAVNTFTKYISPDAAKPIPITEAMRNDIIGKQCLKLWPK